MHNRRSARPRLESMEDRLALSTVSVAAPAAEVHTTRLATVEAHKAHEVAVHAAKHDLAARTTTSPATRTRQHTRRRGRPRSQRTSSHSSSSRLSAASNSHVERGRDEPHSEARRRGLLRGTPKGRRASCHPVRPALVDRADHPLANPNTRPLEQYAVACLNTENRMKTGP